MAGVNKAIIIGNLGAEPEIRHLSSGAAVANIRVATSETYKDRQTGERREQTEWHSVVLWRGLAEITEKYLRKGSKVYIEGKLRTRSWEDQSGQKRYTTEIHADNMTMLDRASSSGDQSYGQPAAAATHAGAAPAANPAPVAVTPAPVQAAPAQAPVQAAPAYAAPSPNPAPAPTQAAPPAGGDVDDLPF